jgi:hypothetical protein
MQINIRMTTKTMNYEIVVQAFDVVIALLGGFISLLYDSGEYCLEHYQHYNL